MTQIHCTLTRDREETLIAYVYDDIDPVIRASFDQHLVTCERCRTELRALSGVRTQLARWSPPEPSFARPATDGPSLAGQVPQDARRSTWRDLPAWAQVAAALLFVGVSAGIANLDVRYDHNGVTMRTGWSRPPAAAGATVTPVAQPAQMPAPWRSDLAALERQLRTEMRAVQTAGAPPRPVSIDAEVLRRVRALLDESERRQQNEVALRVAEAISGINARRQAELKRIDSSLKDVESKVGFELMRQRGSLNYLINNVSQRQ